MRKQKSTCEKGRNREYMTKEQIFKTKEKYKNYQERHRAKKYKCRRFEKREDMKDR